MERFDVFVPAECAGQRADRFLADLEEIELTRREVRDCLDKVQRRKLMQLVDAQTLLREQISLASFTAGFKLAWGIAKELEWNDIQKEEQEWEVNENG